MTAAPVAMRDAFGEALLALAPDFPEMVVLDADVSTSTRTAAFGKRHPDRFFNVGVAEANMVDIAAGMATCGLRPVVNTFALFLTLKAADQVRNIVCYNKLPVILAGNYAGLSDSYDGASHQSILDLAIMRAMPNLTVVVPADGVELRQALTAALRRAGPVYLRICRNPTPVLFADAPPLEIGKIRKLRDGKQITIAVCGIPTSMAIEAADHLRGGGRQTVQAQPRRRERRWPGIGGGRQILLQFRERGRSGASRSVHENPQCIAEPVKQSRPQDLVIGKREQTRPQCQQMAREVPAVHRRNVERWQRFQRLRVVPVVEVASMPFQGVHRAEGIRRALDKLSGRNVAEVVRGQIGEERKSHVGRRRAMPDRSNGMLLIAIRWQPMIFRADECLEECPGPPGKLPEKDGLVSGQPCSVASERPADPPGDSGGGKPEAQYGPSHCERDRPRKCQRDHRGSGENGGDPHRPTGGREVCAVRAIRVARRTPLQ